MPRRANMKMKRMSRTSRALIEAIEFTRDFTRFPIDDQYLKCLKRYCSARDWDGKDYLRIIPRVVW
jgi:hypothetical protein